MKLFLALCFAILGTLALADNPEKEAHAPSQSAADVLREFAGVDGAFMAAGLVKGNFQKDDLSSLLQYPGDELVVISINGSQVRQAFERSLSMLPQPNTGFLQVSGFEISYSRSAPSGQRVLQVKCNGSALEESKNYQIAMPSSLGRGGLGYFKIWDKAKITKTFDKVTVESILKGKRFTDTTPRWLASGL